MQPSLRATFLLLAVLIQCCATALMAQWHIPTIAGTLPNAAFGLGNGCFELSSGANTRGVIWDSAQINLSQPFDISLQINQQPWGADGLALVLQNVGLTANGAGANGLGYANSSPAAPGYPGISNSVAFEVDTWDNSMTGILDIPEDHLAIHINGNLTAAIGGPVRALATGNDITDALCHQFRVTWDPSTTNLRVFFDGVPTPRININYDMINLVFGGNPLVWWGITAGSGGAGMTQRVCTISNFAQAGADRYACAGDTLQLQASGGNSYAWSPAGPLLSANNISNPIFGPSASGTFAYQVIATNATLCTDRDSIILVIESLPIADPGLPTNVCLGDSIRIGTAANPSYTYLWQPSTNLSNSAAAQPWFYATASGTQALNLIATNALGLAACADTASLSITVHDTPNVSITTNPAAICQGQSANLSGTVLSGNPPFSYTWSNGPSTSSQVLSPSATTAYSLTVSDLYNCSSSAQSSILVNDTPSVAMMAAPPSICPGQSSTLSASASGGTAGYTYLWSTGNTANNWLASPVISTSYQVTATDALGCLGHAGILLMVNATDSLDILQADTLLCGNDPVQIANTFGTAGIDVWTWTPTAGISNPAIPNPAILPNASTTYYLTGTNSITGCSSRDSIVLAYVPLLPPSLNLQDDTTICAGQSLTLLVSYPGFSLRWTDGSTSPNFTANAAGIVGLSVYDTLGCNYLAADSFNLSLAPLPRVVLPNDTIICPADSIRLMAGPGSGTAVWNGTDTANTFWVSGPGLYWLRISDSLGCSGSDSIQINYSSAQTAQILGLDSSYCVSDPSVPIQFLPSNGSFTGAVDSLGFFDPAFWGPGAWDIRYVFVDSFGCSYRDTAKALIAPLPSPAFAGPDLVVTGPFQLNANLPSVGLGQWSILGGGTAQLSNPNDPFATISNISTSNLQLVWTISNPPCPSNQDTMRLVLENLVLPSGFSPNGDGSNDLYYIRGLENYPSAQLRIFNRWGNLVWESSAYRNTWDGSNQNGQALAEDTYYAILDLGERSLNTYVVLKRD